jgi:hypothetical protein
MQIPARRHEGEPALAHRRQMGAARHEGHIAAGLGQGRPESTTNTAGTNHCDPHSAIAFP